MGRSLAMAGEGGEEGGGVLELVRGIHVHEGDRRVTEPSHIGFGDLDDTHTVEESHDPELPGQQPFLDVRKARLPVRGMHGLELAADTRNDDVALAGARDDQPDDFGVKEPHVASDREWHYTRRSP